MSRLIDIDPSSVGQLALPKPDLRVFATGATNVLISDEVWASIPAALISGGVVTDGGNVNNASIASYLIGTGSPVGAVTPSGAGVEYVDTSQTVGARKWLSTGATNTSWVVTDGDTGWRDHKPTNITSQFPTTTIFAVRRIGNTVTVRVALTGTVSTATTYSAWLPTGFRPASRFATAYDSAATAAEGFVFDLASTGTLILTGLTTAAVMLDYSWTTVEAWPTSLPGSAL